MRQTRTHRSNSFASFIVAAGLFGSAAMPASATFHEWRVSEIFSNASGSVQFIEFEQPSFQIDDERFLGGQSLTESSLGHAFTFPANLPVAPAAGSHFLVATPGYAALAGVPTADYVLPANNWFNRAGDSITFATFVDTLTFTGAQYPTDASNSLQRTAWGSTTFTTGVNSPTNFAGTTGSVVLPEPTTLAVIAGGALLARRRR